MCALFNSNCNSSYNTTELFKWISFIVSSLTTHRLNIKARGNELSLGNKPVMVYLEKNSSPVSCEILLSLDEVPLLLQLGDRLSVLLQLLKNKSSEIPTINRCETCSNRKSPS